MTDIHTKEFAITREEFIRVNTALFLREGGLATIRGLTTLIFVIVPLFWWLSEGSGKPWLLALGVVIFLLLMMSVINPIRVVRRQANSQQCDYFFENTFWYEFQDNFLLYHSSDGNMCKITRNSLSKFVKRSNYYLLTSHMRVHYIPQRAFSSPGDIEEFEKLFSGIEWEYKTKRAVSKIENI